MKLYVADDTGASYTVELEGDTLKGRPIEVRRATIGFNKALKLDSAKAKALIKKAVHAAGGA